MTKDKHMRIKGSTLKMLRILAGEIQIETGENITDDDAICELFKLCRPDIIERVKEIEAKQANKSKGE